MTWPSMFSDSNPIEYLWSIFNWKVEQQNPSIQEQLKRIIYEEQLHNSPHNVLKCEIIHVQEVPICCQK